MSEDLFERYLRNELDEGGSRELSAASIGFSDSGRGDSAIADDARWKTAQTRSKSAIERLFSPEFRNRLDAIVTFGNLSMEVMETIVEKFVLQLEAQLAERHVAITLSPEARAWLARKGYDQIYGARPLGRVVQKDVRDPLTDEILFGKLENGGTVTIGVDGDKLAFSYAAREPQAQDIKTQDSKSPAPKTQDARPKTH